MQRTFLLPVALAVLAITQNRGQTGMHLAPCPNVAGDGEIRRGPVLGRRTRALREAVKVFLQFFRPPLPGCARVVHYGV
jgi:hypothetical protein